MKTVQIFNDGLNICILCRARITRCSSFKLHVQTRHNEKSSFLLAKECSECDTVFPNRHFYQMHFIGVHDKRSVQEIDSGVDIELTPRKNRTENLSSVSGQKDEPAKKQKKGNGSKIPIEDMNGATPVTEVCEECGRKDFKTHAVFMKHQQQHIIDIHICKICRYVLQNKSSARSHLNSKHP